MKTLVRTLVIAAMVIAYSSVIDIPAQINISNDTLILNSKGLVLLGIFIFAEVISDIKSSMGRLMEASIIIGMVILLSDVVVILQNIFL